MACANTVVIGLADDWDSLRCDYFGRRIPPFAFGRGAVDLDELREVDSVAQRGFESEGVSGPSVGCHLVRLRGGRVAQALDERVGCLLIALAQGEVQDQFRIVSGLEGLLLLEAESPNFIELHVGYR